jgi:GNAT superfamily N-acetyltransferase
VTSFVSVALDEHHKLGEFDCGVPALNEWLTAQAMRATVSGTAKSYVWIEPESDRVVAYYSITPHQVHRAEVSSGLSGGVTTIPSYLLARLALDRALHGQGLGGQLLRDALERVVEAADVASGRLLVVDAIDEQAAAFYRRHDFQPVKGNPHRLVIKIATVRKALVG